MRVGIDYRVARTHAPGAGRYARELVRALVRLPAPPELVLFDVGRGDAAVPDDALGLRDTHAIARHVRWAVPRRVVDWAARVGWTADRWCGGVDVFHRVEPAPLAVTFARVVRGVAELPPKDDERFAAIASELRALDGVFVFSEHGARRVVDDAGVDPARVHRTPVGCDHWRRDFGPAGPPPRAPLDARPARVLVLGALREAARPRALLEALGLLHARGLATELVWAGRAGDGVLEWRAARDAAPTARHDANPGEADLRRLVAEADVVVVRPGEALTPVTALEACSLGAAVLADRLPALEEALGALAEWVEPAERDPAALADALARTIARSADEGERAARLALAERYGWRQCAIATHHAYRARN